MNWSELHDATFQRLEIVWDEAVARVIVLRWYEGRTRSVAICFRAFTSIDVPRTLPWGASASVNEVRVHEAGSGIVAEIEIQSGDTIKIAAKEVVVE
jgi:hypothetical protein